MRYPPDHKARAREALLEAGARSLKTTGFNGIGVDGLAAAAGVTSGAFYSNFPSKTAVGIAVIDELYEREARRLEAALSASDDVDGWFDALAGLVKGPRMLKMVRMPSSLRTGAACFMAL